MTLNEEVGLLVIETFRIVTQGLTRAQVCICLTPTSDFQLIDGPFKQQTLAMKRSKNSDSSCGQLIGADNETAQEMAARGDGVGLPRRDHTHSSAGVNCCYDLGHNEENSSGF